MCISQRSAITRAAAVNCFGKHTATIQPRAPLRKWKDCPNYHTGFMANPHEAEIEEINRLSNDRLIKKEIWEIVALAIPRGEADEVAKNLHIGGKPVTGNTVRSWRNDPNGDSAADPWGRGSPAEHFEQFIAAVYARFPEGAWLLLRYFLLKHAKSDAIHGREAMLNALEVNDEVTAMLEQTLEVLRRRARKKK